MKKSSFNLLAILTFILSTNDWSISKDQNIRYFVYGAVTNLECGVCMCCFIPEIDNQVAADVNHVTEDVSPFLEEQLLADFSESCSVDPTRACLLSVMKQNDVVVEVLEVFCGEFQGF